MTRLARASRARWLGAAFVALVLLLPPATADAEDQTGGECGDASTPNLVITAANAGKSVPRLTLTVQTNKDAVPHWNVIYRDGSNVLDSLEIHRVFIKAHEGEESLVATEEDGCGCGSEEGDDEGGMTGAGIRGIGYLSNGAKVRVQIDVKDYGNNPHQPDQVRVRWRVFVEGDTGDSGSGNCEGTSWIYNSGWINVLQVNIQQR